MSKPYRLPGLLGIFFLFSCQKTGTAPSSPTSSFTGIFEKYTISAGEHYCDHNPFLPVQYSELKFTARFDSSCIYQTTDPSNQEDINKLYGFSDNQSQHQEFSARFGWNWARNALRLYAYVYNHGERQSKEITSIGIGVDYNCSIRIDSNKYIFSANKHIVEMDRSSIGRTAIGYKLYPYFGGDEAAPHDIRIWIKE